MTTCPHCGETVEEGARVCLACMAPLCEKTEPEKPAPRRPLRWLVPALCAAALCLAAGAGVFFLLRPQGGEAFSTAASAVPLEAGEGAAGTDAVSAPAEKVPGAPEQTAPTTGGTSKQTAPTTGGSTSKQTAPTTGGTSQQTAPTTGGGTSQQTAPTTGGSTSQQTAPTTGGSTPPADTPAGAAVTYLYRAAEHGDDYFANTVPAESDIVITGVSLPSASGVYEIPAYIGENRVVAIVKNAFSAGNIAPTVKTVIVPATVREIKADAFAGCVNLRDLYFGGAAVHMWAGAVPEACASSLVIHTSYDCTDRNFHVWRTYAASLLGASWREYNA